MTEKVPGGLLPQDQEATREQIERQLADRVQFIEQDGKNTGQKIMEGEQVMVTAFFEPTEVGNQIAALLKEYDQQYGSNDAWACIRSNAVINARQLAEKYGLLPQDKNVSSHFASGVYELGVDLNIDGGTTNDQKHRDKQALMIEEATDDMKELAEKIRALGVACQYREW